MEMRGEREGGMGGRDGKREGGRDEKREGEMRGVKEGGR